MADTIPDKDAPAALEDNGTGSQNAPVEVMATGGSTASIGQPERSNSRDRAVTTAAVDGPVTKEELWGWYAYDWANSPFWQVFDPMMKWLMKRSAEYAKAEGRFNLLGMSAGSYPAFIMWITAALQVVCLLSFSAFGDYGKYRKMLLKAMTYIGCAMLGLCICCFDSQMWWLAGLLRILAGVCFVLANVYYNAYLPLLTSQHPQVLALEGAAAVQREVELSDEISASGFGVGYAGGFAMQIICFVLLMFFECTESCLEFDRLFMFCICIVLVGVWWFTFSMYTFKHLKERAGAALPEGANLCCLGWIQAGKTLCVVVKLRQILLFMIAYFIWSDALATTQNVSILYMDEKQDEDGEVDAMRDSTKMMSLAAAALMGLFGVIGLLKFQQRLKLSNKAMLLGQLVAYGVVCAACGCGALSAFGDIGYYLCMTPVVMMMGSLQANTRSLYSSLSPVGMEAAMFAFYAITDKGSSLVGAVVIGVVHTWTGSYVGVFWYCMLAFFLSAFLLYFVDVKQGMQDASRGTSEQEISEKISFTESEGSPPSANAVGKSES